MLFLDLRLTLFSDFMFIVVSNWLNYYKRYPYNPISELYIAVLIDIVVCLSGVKLDAVRAGI